MPTISHTVSLFFNDVSKILCVNMMITAHNMIYNFFASGIYITNLILYSNQNNINFTIGTLVYSVAMIPGCTVIYFECT